jgi:HK97 family phage portal protein
MLSRILDAFRGKAAEGEYRPGPYPLISGGVLPDAWGQYANFWQMGFPPQGIGGYAGSCSAMVEACVSAYAQTLAQCQLNHWIDLGNGGRQRVTNSALSRVMRAPNDYQTASDFILNAVRSLFLEGNAYALALRNDRYEVSSLHLMRPANCWAEPIQGEVFYSLGGNTVINSRLDALDYGPLSNVPARDVFHVKLHSSWNILRGETPLAAAAMSLAAGNAALSQMATFYANQARPSGTLQTDLTLTATQVTELRARWEEQSKGLQAGGTPILTNGLKFAPISVNAADAQFAEMMKYSDQQIAQVYGIPMAIIGSEAQPMGSTEALMAFWISKGLGFALNQVELAIDRLFGLSKIDGEYSEFDTSILLRSAFKDRIDALTKAVQGGIYSPNEARALESLPAAEDGDEPRVQQQVVPLSAWDRIPPPAAPGSSSGAPAPDPESAAEDAAAGDNEATGKALEVVARALEGLRDKIDEYGNVIRLPGPPGPPGPPGEPAYPGRARGLYSPAEAYRAMDVVSFNGSEWRAITDEPGPLPGEGWMLGAKGSRGKRGERGAPGPVTRAEVPA